MRYTKGATMTYLVSIWTGIIMVGVLLFPNNFSAIWTQLNSIYSNPTATIPNMVVQAFTGPMANYLVTMLGLGVVGVAVTTYLLGGGFTLLFAIPLILIMSVINIFVLPTTTILMSTGIPSEIKMIYTLFIGGLTLLTVYSFTAGRP